MEEPNVIQLSHGEGGEAGFDLGYASSKGEFPGIGKTVVIPSAVARPCDSFAGFACSQKIFDLPHGKFVFGKDALIEGSKPIHSQTPEWLMQNMAGLICAVASEAGVDLHTIKRPYTGMPIETWRKYRHRAAEELRIIRCGKEVYEFDSVEVYPQAVGALATYTAKHNPPANETGLVVDIGGNTVLTVRYDHLKATGTHTVEHDKAGVLQAAKKLIPFLSSQLNSRRNVTSIQAMQALRSRVFNHTDVGEQVDAAIAEYCEDFLGEFRDGFGDIAETLGMLVVAGGGAHLVGEALKNEYPRVTVLAEPEFANVRGYLLIASGKNRSM